jgi:hypothetical protein
MSENNKLKPTEEWTKAYNEMMYPWGVLTCISLGLFIIMGIFGIFPLCIFGFLSAFVFFPIVSVKHRKLEGIQKFDQLSPQLTEGENLKDDTQVEIGQHNSEMPDNNDIELVAEWISAQNWCELCAWVGLVCTMFAISANITAAVCGLLTFWLCAGLPTTLLSITAIITYKVKNRRIKYLEKHIKNFTCILKDRTKVEAGQHIDDGKVMYRVLSADSGYSQVTPVAVYKRRYKKWIVYAELAETILKRGPLPVSNARAVIEAGGIMTFSATKLRKFSLNTEEIYTGYEAKHGKQEAKETSFTPNRAGYYFTEQNEEKQK